MLTATHRIEIPAQSGVGLNEPGKQKKGQRHVAHDGKVQPTHCQERAEELVLDAQAVAAGQKQGETGAHETHRQGRHEARNLETDMNHPVDETQQSSNYESQRDCQPGPACQGAAPTEECKGEKDSADRDRAFHRKVDGAHDDDEGRSDRHH